ncbi:MAG: serine/threonine protein kinase [Deltaproteobacteria bacterium]|nr:serine/threonine protein kinase [Deltaproteobacteria bacterium]MBI3296251.1 serine/threonine protein kinase [Deltaproteobacteria bacterium]
MDDKTRITAILAKSEGTNLRGVIDELQIIARGGMSHIYRARQPSLDRYVVVKQLKDELFSNPEMLERFRREAKALAAVLHQNVAHVYDFVESGSQSYILMEYIEGADLSFILSKLGQLPFEMAAAVALGIARGVSYIHAHNLIHRDIKPANIRLTTRGGVKLMDFGIVMNLDHENLTRPGLMVGSPSYLSPEQVLGDPITHRADLFLIGIVLYEMLTGVRPFREEGGKTVFQAIRESQYVPLKKMRSTVPAALDRIVRRCLKVKPDDRFENVKELIKELESYLGGYRSSHIDDLVLRFLDQEAILTPAIPYLELDERKMSRRIFGIEWSWSIAALLVIGLGLGLGVGFWMGSHPGAVPNAPRPFPPTHSYNR